MICGPKKKEARIFVVDGEPKDYSHVVDAVQYDKIQFKFFTSGRDALRHNPEDEPEMWVLNMRLQDMSGVELSSMLRSRGTNVPMTFVGDNYDVDAEIDARTNGAALYFAKPLMSEWLIEAGERVAIEDM